LRTYLSKNPPGRAYRGSGRPDAANVRVNGAAPDRAGLEEQARPSHITRDLSNGHSVKTCRRRHYSAPCERRQCH